MPAPILALLQLAGTLIPAIGALFPQQSEVAKRNVAVAGLVSDALVKAVGAASPESPPPVNLQAAVEKLDDPAILQRTSAALSSDPTLTALVEVGGGVDAARKAVAAYSPKDGDAWYVIIIKTVFNPVVMISAAFIPALYKMVDALISRISDVSPDVVAQSYGTVLGFIGMVAAFWFGLTWAQRNIQRSDNNHGA